MKAAAKILLIILLQLGFAAWACECPELPRLTTEYTSGIDLVFKGSVQNITECRDGLAKAHFMLQALYKGTSPKGIDVYFDCEKCPMNFNVGETWIIYANYAQVGKPDVNFCSRSKKLVDNEIEIKTQFIPSDYSFSEEAEWLQKNLGTHAFMEGNNKADFQHKNELPTPQRALVLIAVSLTGMLLVFFVVKKLLK